MDNRIKNYISPFLRDNKITKNDFENLFGSFDTEMMEIVLDFTERNNIEIINKNKSIDMIYHSKNRNIELTNEQLCVMYKRGDVLALDAIIQKNEKLIYSRVKKFTRSFNHDLTDEDLFQEGCMGLIKGVEKFDNDLGFKLTTYAIIWIDQSITRAIADKGFTIRVPVHMFDKVVKVNLIYRDLELEDMSKEEELEIIRDKVGIGEDELNRIKFISQDILNITSLNTNVGENLETELVQLIKNTECLDVFEEVANHMLIEDIDTVLYSLTSREKEIITLRFGLNDNNEHTLEEVGKKQGVTRERIRQIEAKGLRKLKHPSRLKYLRGYLIDN